MIMKLIIDIDDEHYKDAVNDTEWDTLSLGIYLKEKVKEGKPLQEELEEISKEIEQIQTHIVWGTIYSVPKEPQEIRAKCLQILDNHIKERTNE